MLWKGLIRLFLHAFGVITTQNTLKTGVEFSYHQNSYRYTYRKYSGGFLDQREEEKPIDIKGYDLWLLLPVDQHFLPMTSIRKSKRHSTVKNSELLAKKLEERCRKRKLKAKTSSKEGSSPEERVETEEFFDIIEDLEWDSSADFEESYIEIEESPTNCRKNTSTDYNLIDEVDPVEEKDQIWPPRNPSEEPTDPNLSIFNLPHGYSIESIFETIENEVFEDRSDIFSAMDNQEFNRRFNEIKLAKRNVTRSIAAFPTALVAGMDSTRRDSKQRIITDCLQVFDDKVGNLELDLNDEDENDKRRLDELPAME